ncbi:MAG: type I-F CRISPR-associated endoribonuclease Cas6/Csy4 [Xanthomonadales bacterium]|nr:type I-F CRISPR-associated endoribonuclease Cas6/Csy4 [Xanthomonadales bacterium]
MTSHYIDLEVVPDTETGAPTLMGALYDRLHRVLAERRTDNVGVSFPRYSASPRAIGSMLRLHGNESALQDFVSGEWLRGVRDHVRIGRIAPVPEGAQHRFVGRRQFKSNIERLRRRRMKRKNETVDQAALAIPDSAIETPSLPFVRLHSLSTGQAFPLFIVVGPPQSSPSEGTFNSYGLGCPATVPWF